MKDISVKKIGEKKMKESIQFTKKVKGSPGYDVFLSKKKIGEMFVFPDAETPTIRLSPDFFNAEFLFIDGEGNLEWDLGDNVEKATKLIVTVLPQILEKAKDLKKEL